jgi:hypothetical protein
VLCCGFSPIALIVSSFIVSLRNVNYYIERFSSYLEELHVHHNPFILTTAIQRYYQLFHKWSNIKLKNRLSFFEFIESDAFQFFEQPSVDNKTTPATANKNRLLFYLLIPLLEFIRIIDVAKKVSHFLSFLLWVLLLSCNSIYYH